MSWVTPKTDWSVRRDSTGRIVGDYINNYDYNRIKGNMAYLFDLARQVIANVPSYSFGADKVVTDYPYADEYNNIENALRDLARAVSVNLDYGATKVFSENGKMIDYAELNRIERSQLDLKARIESIVNGRRRLAFVLGTRREV